MNDSSSIPATSEADSLAERSILDIGIPPCPAILDRFMTEMRKDEPDYKRLALIIGSDVSLTAGLIKTANSPFFGLSQRVKSGFEALTMLGLKNSSRVIAGIILRHSFQNVRHLEIFWEASAHISNISGWLARQLKIRGLQSENAYTFGLFRDCGIPVLLGRFPHYAAVLDKANRDSSLGFNQIEEAELPMNHAMVGCMLAQSWWLPEEISLAIRYHHDLGSLESVDSQLPMLTRRLIATAQLAEHIMQKLLGLSYTRQWETLATVCLKLLNLDDDQLEGLYVAADLYLSAEE